MGKPSAPPAPDYADAARAQGDANLQAGQQQNTLNNPNVNAPGYSISYQNHPGPDNTARIRTLQDEIKRLNEKALGEMGNMERVMYERNPEKYKGANHYYGKIQDLNSQIDTLTKQKKSGRPTQDIKLSPGEQAIFDLNNQTQKNLSQIGVDSSQRIGNLLSTPFDMSSIDRDKIAESLMARDQPMMDRARSRRETQLANQGIMQGSEAYNSAQDELARAENDFRLGAYNQAGNEASRDLGMQTAIRQMPINEINALRSGTQLNIPQTGVQGTQIGAAPIFDSTMGQYGAQMGLYNAKAAQQAGLTNGLFSLGAAALMA
jgi:hypothetical protein